MSCDRCRDGALCSYHLRLAYDHTRGLVDGRGVEWANRVARKVSWQRQCQPWPDTPRMMAIARQLVGDLDRRDPRLREMLARTCADHAAKRWAQLGRRLVERAMR